jgi:hypothetical protein
LKSSFCFLTDCGVTGDNNEEEVRCEVGEDGEGLNIVDGDAFTSNMEFEVSTKRI